MSYTETVNPKTVDLMKGDYRKDIRSKCEDTFKDRKNDLKSEYDKKNEAKKRDEKKSNNQEKKPDKKELSRDRKNEDKKNEKDKKDKVKDDRKTKERKPSENRKDRENKKPNEHKTEGKRSDKKHEEKKNDKTEEECKNNVKPSQNMQVSVAKALEQFNVNPVALLVSKMIDQQSLVVKLLTEAREKDIKKFDFSEKTDRADEICRMREKVRILERQLKTLELSLEGKADKFDAITKTESTQTQQYGIDNATNTHLDERGETREVSARLNQLRQRHTCNII